MEEKLLRVKLASLSMQRYSWEQGVLAQAFLESGDWDVTIQMAKEAIHRQTADGRCANIGKQDAATDPCAIGEAMLYACEHTQDPLFCQANEKLLNWALREAPRNQAGVVYHMCSSRQFWVDSFYMLPPYLARAGCYDEALRQINGYWDALFDPNDRLLSHRWDDGNHCYLRKDYWGVGNGWAAAGMARVIRTLPDAYATAKEELSVRVDTILRSALRYQRSDGLFHDVLDQPSSFREVNCGQMFAYTIYRGVSEGWLKDDLLPAAEKIHAAVQPEVDAYGFVQNVCGVPAFDRPYVAPEGQAFYILMEAARRNCLENRDRTGIAP